MDLNNLIGTSTFAIEAVYNDFWNLIPKKYRISEDDFMIKDMTPFYDPELTFDNRMHYKLTNVEYPKRATPWFVITWNTENGLIKSDLTQRRFQSALDTLPDGDRVRFNFINTDLNINFGIVSNTMTGIFELQENFILKKRNKMVVYTKEHPILGSFPVSLDVIDSQQNKLSRDKGTICYLMVQCKIDYPIIGNVSKPNGGIIETINYQINQEDTDKVIYAEGTITANDLTP